MEPRDQVLHGGIGREAAERHVGLVLGLGDLRLAGDERDDVVEGGDQRLHLGGDGVGVVGDGDRGGAAVPQGDGHAGQDVAEGVRLALEGPAEAVHGELGVLPCLRGLDGERGVVVRDRDRAGCARRLAGDLEAEVRGRRRAEVDGRGRHAGVERVDGGRKTLERGGGVHVDALDGARPHLELERHAAGLGAGAGRGGEDVGIARRRSADEHTVGRRERVRRRAERGELAAERVDGRLRGLDVLHLDAEQLHRPFLEGDQLVDDRVGVEAGREAADGDQARHAALASDEERAGDREIPGPVRTDRSTRLLSAGARGPAPGAGWPARGRRCRPAAGCWRG